MAATQQKIEKMKSLTGQYLQYKKSRLWTETQEVMGLVDSEIDSVVDGFCNIVSFWALMVVAFEVDVSYKEFLSTLFKNKMVKHTGWISASKTEIMELYGIDFDLEYFESWADVIDPDRLEEGCFYQCKLQHGLHFFACVLYQGELWGFDTMRRGTWFKVIDKILPQRFDWLLKFGNGGC